MTIGALGPLGPDALDAFALGALLLALPFRLREQLVLGALELPAPANLLLLLEAARKLFLLSLELAVLRGPLPLHVCRVLLEDCLALLVVDFAELLHASLLGILLLAEKRLVLEAKALDELLLVLRPLLLELLVEVAHALLHLARHLGLKLALLIVQALKLLPDGLLFLAFVSLGLLEHVPPVNALERQLGTHEVLVRVCRLELVLDFILLRHPNGRARSCSGPSRRITRSRIEIGRAHV